MLDDNVIIILALKSYRLELAAGYYLLCRMALMFDIVSPAASRRLHATADLYTGMDN